MQSDVGAADTSRNKLKEIGLGARNTSLKAGFVALLLFLFLDVLQISIKSSLDVFRLYSKYDR